jgi:hypothetical protein
VANACPCDLAEMGGWNRPCYAARRVVLDRRRLAFSLSESCDAGHTGHPDFRATEDLRGPVVPGREMGHGQVDTGPTGGLRHGRARRFRTGQRRLGPSRRHRSLPSTRQDPEPSSCLGQGLAPSHSIGRPPRQNESSRMAGRNLAFSTLTPTGRKPIWVRTAITSFAAWEVCAPRPSGPASNQTRTERGYRQKRTIGPTRAYRGESDKVSDNQRVGHLTFSSFRDSDRSPTSAEPGAHRPLRATSGAVLGLDGATRRSFGRHVLVSALVVVRATMAGKSGVPRGTCG